MDIFKREHRIVIVGKCDGFFSIRYLEWIKNKIKLLDVILWFNFRFIPFIFPLYFFSFSLFLSLFSTLFDSNIFVFSCWKCVEPFILLWKWEFIETIWHHIFGGFILWTLNYTTIMCGITSGKIIAKGRQITGELDWSLTPNKLVISFVGFSSLIFLFIICFVASCISFSFSRVYYKLWKGRKKYY